MNIYVGNLSWNLKDQDLADLFTPYGEVASGKNCYRQIHTTQQRFWLC